MQDSRTFQAGYENAFSDLRNWLRMIEKKHAWHFGVDGDEDGGDGGDGGDGDGDGS